MPGAFDSLAGYYDRDFTFTAVGQYLRGQVHDRLLTHFKSGDHVLEMGCGTGEDTLFLAQQGMRVTAADSSAAMLAVAREKTRHLPEVTIQKLDLRTLDSTSLSDTIFHGAFSNFGAFNCLDTWQPAASWLAERVKPGGRVCLGIMPPFCLWEIIWHSLHLDFGVALRRFRGSTFQPDEHADSVPVVYPTIRRITRDFAPYFRRVYVRPLGICLPPSDVYGVIEKRPRLLRTLLAAEQRFGKIGSLALFADHYWIEFERTESQP